MCLPKIHSQLHPVLLLLGSSLRPQGFARHRLQFWLYVVAYFCSQGSSLVSDFIMPNRGESTFRASHEHAPLRKISHMHFDGMFAGIQPYLSARAAPLWSVKPCMLSTNGRAVSQVDAPFSFKIQCSYLLLIWKVLMTCICKTFCSVSFTNKFLVF